MSLVTLETYGGDKVDINPDFVQAVTSHNSFDENLPLPEDFYFLNGGGDPEVRKDRRDQANALRTSERTLVLMANGTSFEVRGSTGEVKKALGGK